MYYLLSMKRTRIFPCRLSDEEAELAEAIQRETGASSLAAVFRQALLDYAKKLGIHMKRER
jgi:hypothetical protein